jgi:hypothetical protein
MTIKKVDGKFCVFDEEGEKNLGCFPTEEQAQERLREIEFFSRSQREEFESIVKKGIEDGRKTET